MSHSDRDPSLKAPTELLFDKDVAAESGTDALLHVHDQNFTHFMRMLEIIGGLVANEDVDENSVQKMIDNLKKFVADNRPAEKEVPSSRRKWDGLQVWYNTNFLDGEIRRLEILLIQTTLNQTAFTSLIGQTKAKVRRPFGKAASTSVCLDGGEFPLRGSGSGGH